MKYLLILLMIWGCTPNNRIRVNEPISVESSIQNRNLNFREYWDKFRKVILSNNTDQIEELCHFPLVIRGEQDGEPVLKINKNDFNNYFELFLKREVFIKGENITNFDFIKQTKEAEKSFGFQETETWRRVGDLEFELENNGWVLVLIYYPLR